MPVVRDIPLNLQIREVLRQSGIKDVSKLKFEMETLIGELLASVNDEALLEPAVLVCTIGGKLEEKVVDYFDKSKPLPGLLLDGIGSASTDALTQEVCRLTRHGASLRGYQTSSPLSPGGPGGPGGPGFPPSEQWQLFKLVPAEEIGVRLTSTGFMVSRKSTSMVIGIGPQMTTWTEAEACARCNLSKTCRYRIHT